MLVRISLHDVVLITDVIRGTESPLLALNMIAKAVKARHGLTLSFDHVFSCEIEPFKQAYIERNFSPPILFRDVTELGNKRAHTAYGSLVPVPGNVDVSIEWHVAYVVKSVVAFDCRHIVCGLLQLEQ